MSGNETGTDGAARKRAGSERPLRADARRNRDRLVEAARTVLGRAEGPLSLEEVAREAGVGIGTLYRHFPTRDTLVETVYSVELDELTASATALLAEHPPHTALREWMMRYARFVTRKRGMIDILRASFTSGRIQAPLTRARITKALGPLVTAGAEEGTLRADVDPDDVTLLLWGVSLATSSDSGTEQAERLLGLVMDALRPTES